MKLQKILDRFLRLHPKEIDLSLDRIKNICNKLDNPQNNLKCIQIAGTNGKYSTIQAIRSILKEAGINCNIYTSPHIQKINERFVYNDEKISDENLFNLLSEIEEINAGEPITYFEILTAAFFYGCKKYSDNLTMCEFGLFSRFDAVNILKNNLATIVTAIGLDHLDWLPENDRNIDRIIFEKTSRLLKSKIIVAEQDNQEILDKIEISLAKNNSKKIIFKKNFNYSLNENNFFLFEDRFGSLKLPFPNLLGNFQLSNISSAIATVRELKNYNVTDEHIKSGITKIKSTARLQEIKEGKLKNLSKRNTLIVDGSHNPLGASVIKKYLEDQMVHKKIYIITGMMNNKNHKEYIYFFKNIAQSIIVIDIPNQKNSIKKEKLKSIIDKIGILCSAEKSIQNAIETISKKEQNCLILITGSLYLAGEILNLN